LSASGSHFPIGQPVLSLNSFHYLSSHPDFSFLISSLSIQLGCACLVFFFLVSPESDCYCDPLLCPGSLTSKKFSRPDFLARLLSTPGRPLITPFCHQTPSIFFPFSLLSALTLFRSEPGSTGPISLPPPTPLSLLVTLLSRGHIELLYASPGPIQTFSFFDTKPLLSHCLQHPTPPPSITWTISGTSLGEWSIFSQALRPPDPLFYLVSACPTRRLRGAWIRLPILTPLV